MKGRKTGGRKQGSRNRTSVEIREALLVILNNNLDRLSDAIKRMKDEEAAKLLIQLARHLTYPEMSPEKLTETQLLQIIKYLKENEKQS